MKRIKVIHSTPIRKIVDVSPRQPLINPDEVARALGAERIPRGQLAQYQYLLFYELGSKPH